MTIKRRRKVSLESRERRFDCTLLWRIPLDEGLDWTNFHCMNRLRATGCRIDMFQCFIYNSLGKLYIAVQGRESFRGSWSSN